MKSVRTVYSGAVTGYVFAVVAAMLTRDYLRERIRRREIASLDRAWNTPAPNVDATRREVVAALTEPTGEVL